MCVLRAGWALHFLGLAKFGSAPRLGRGGPRFESESSDWSSGAERDDVNSGAVEIGPFGETRPEVRGFDPRLEEPPRTLSFCGVEKLGHLAGPITRSIVGSNPTTAMAAVAAQRRVPGRASGVVLVASVGGT